MTDPLLESLPLLDLARKALPALEYLRVRRWYERREQRREAAEYLRQGRVMTEQHCVLHGLPDPRDVALGSPPWCGCHWKMDWTREGERCLFFHRRDPATGTTLGAVFPAWDLPLREDRLRELREAFSDG